MLKRYRFKRIKKSYEAREKELREKGISIDRLTKKGLFSPSDMDEIFDFFKEIKLQRYRTFLDLGSGDGRIVLIASLFTKAAGIEHDLALARASERMRDSLKIKPESAQFINADYMKQNLSEYDIIFWYPDDQKKEHVERKLLKEMEGKLVIYRGIYMPKKLSKVSSFADDILIIFKNPKRIRPA